MIDNVILNLFSNNLFYNNNKLENLENLSLNFSSNEIDDIEIFS